MNIQQPTIFPMLVMFALCACIGCGNSLNPDYEDLGLIEVSGTVTLDGQPLPDAVVKFEADDLTFCYGTTDSSGRYALKLNSEKYGVTPGEKTVRISTAASTGEEEASGGEEADPDGKPETVKEEKVPACYHKDSKLTVSVTESDSAFNFDLKSDCSTTGRS